MTSSSHSEPVYEDVLDAAERLGGMAVRTPLLESAALNERIGGRLLVKAEMLQRTGSFKFRGAFNRLSRLSAAERSAGVIAFSSGNHAQGVADAARLLGARATIVMPADAPAMKIDNTRGFGAEVVFYDRYGEDREVVAAALLAERGGTIVRPFDDRYVIAGQGTVGLEIARQCKALGVQPDIVLAPCSGGGLIAGCALALAHAFPELALYAVEPEGFDDTRRSLASGRRESNSPGRSSACDALLSPAPGELTFPINERLLAGAVAASDETAFRAMRIAYEELKLVTEPSGALALGAVLSGVLDCRDRTVVVICSGGNVDAAMFAAAIQA